MYNLKTLSKDSVTTAMQTFKNLHSAIFNSELTKYQSERIFIASLIVLTSKLTNEDEVVKFEPLVREVTSKIELTDEEYMFFTDFYIDVEKAKQRIKEYEMEMIADQDN